MSSFSSTRASLMRMGRIVTCSSLSVGVAIGVRLLGASPLVTCGRLLGQARGELLEPRTELAPQVVAIAREAHDRLEVVEAVARVVAAAAEHDPVHAARPVRAGREFLQRVGELDLPTLAGRGALEHLEDLG